MASFFILPTLISFKAAVVQSSISISRRVAVGFSSVSVPRRATAITAARLYHHDQESHFPSKTSPWLMLPPTFNGGDKVYNFYTLAEDKIVSFNQHRGGAAVEKESPDDEALIVGCCRGWLASLNDRNHDVFLSHPLSGQHMKLPPIHAFSIAPVTFPHGPSVRKIWKVKVIISSSPDDEECRALMIYGQGNTETRLAYCVPGRSTEWTPIPGAWHNYENFVYSSRQQRFICINGDFAASPRFAIESWDLRDASCPRIDCLEEDLELDYGNCHWSREEIEGLEEVYYPVLAEDSDELFVVRRFGKYNGDHKDSYLGKAVGFHVLKVDRERGKAVYTSTGPVMFIQGWHSFALSAAEFPQLKPNCIYFTDPKQFVQVGWHAYDGGIDVGIYDYGSRALAHRHCPFYFHRVIRNMPGHMWFSPSNR